ncbi:hypothetical protein ACCC84_17455 [Serratia odorifera]|uniref:hypothetical protein n=1 Tax=Serratia odorifera TaxID=618 RepID=UPI003532370B
MNSLVDDPCFHPDGGQTLQQRLLQLIGTRSRRQAAEDWGIKYATLNNYLTARKSHPRPRIVKQIADAERVDAKWILFGAIERNNVCNKETNNATPAQPYSDNIRFICDMMAVLSSKEIELLRNTLIREGIKTLLALTDEDNLRLLNLARRHKQAALLLERLSDEQLSEFLQQNTPGIAPPALAISTPKD